MNELLKAASTAKVFEQGMSPDVFLAMAMSTKFKDKK